MDISVVICTHNPRADYLRRVLEALQGQTLPRAQWEMLLIDNASDEPLAKTWDLSWHPNARHILEKTLGLTPARLRGIDEAAAEILIFVDDDNVLCPTFLADALRIGREWPQLGAWGSRQLPEFEKGPPAEQWKIDFWTPPVPRDVWSNNYDRKATPIGAGVCIRRSVAAKYAAIVRSDPWRMGLDRKGKSLMSGGDIDMARVACDMGLGTGLFVCLELVHLIPARRTTDDYLIRLHEGFGYTIAVLDAVRGAKSPYRPWRDRLLNYVRLLKFPRDTWPLHVAYDRGRLRALRDLREKSGPVH
ncbi:MAG TPA: glycosyltransferase [Candidatus Methylacidiphilales bacterium]|jgi:glycosyltransferase involved in cell wall biosynthesis|nr:glycosyltransferase [Candidatus Methylacidiphilales bacterium]